MEQSADRTAAEERIREAEIGLSSILKTTAKRVWPYQSTLEGLDPSSLNEHHRKLLRMVDHSLRTSAVILRFWGPRHNVG